MKYLETKHEKKSATITTIIVVILVLLCFVVGQDYQDPPEEYGVAINFGDASVISDNVKSDNSENAKEIESEPEETEAENEEEIVKDEVEEGFKSDAERQAAVASLYSKLGLKGASKRSREKNKGKKKEEVEITEAVSDAYVKQIARMTDRNDHFGARVELARMMKDKELMQMYDSLEKMHRMNLGGNDALTLRSKLDKNLKFRLTQKVKKDADRLMDAL